MPAATRRLTLAQAREVVAQAAAAGACARRVGLEIEGFPTRPHHEVAASLSRVELPGGSRLTFEPGGQVELSGPCVDTPAQACAALEDDLAALSAAGVSLAFTGLWRDGSRPRVLDLPRYAAMEAFFDQDGPAGRTMMRETAALQVNVDGDGDRRWRLAHAIGPVLAAAFANSPVAGFRSGRLAVWRSIDPSRTAPVGGASAVGSWVDYAMAAQVMFVRATADRFVPVAGLSLADWVDGGHPLGWPTEDDVAYHLTTLFPPVRPRGWLELRFFDALPGPWWQAAVAATATLLDDPAASAVAEEACAATAGLWLEAARFGVEHPLLGDAAERCLAAAAASIDDRGLAAAVADFAERYTLRRRCPADDARVPAWG
jgi:glutamate--cysteine ligase